MGERRTTIILRMCTARSWGGELELRVRKSVGKAQGGLEAVLTAVKAARVPGMPRGGGVGSNEFE